MDPESETERVGDRLTPFWGGVVERDLDLIIGDNDLERSSSADSRPPFKSSLKSEPPATALCLILGFTNVG